MNLLSIVAHPERRSFASALAQTALDCGAEAQAAEIIDLYADAFDPVSDRRNFRTVKDPNYFKQQLEERFARDSDGFVEDISLYQRKISRADLVVFCFPLWWGGMPAIMKGFVDKVFASGFAYGGGRMYESGVFRGKRCLLAITTGSREERFVTHADNEGAFGSLEQILFPIRRNIFEFVGMDVLEPFIVHSPAQMSADERKATLERFKLRIANIGR